ADEWLPVRPGTDGLLVMALIHELLRAGKVDVDYLQRWTNAGWLIIDDPGSAEHGLVARDADGRPLALELRTRRLMAAREPGGRVALKGSAVLPNGQRARPAFELLAERFLDPAHAPDAVAERVGLPASTIRRIAAELAHVAFEQPVIVEQA